MWNCESRRDRHPLDTGEPTSEWHGIRGKQKHHYGGWMEEDQDFRSNEVLSIPTAGRFEITFVIWRHFEHHARRVSECVYASRSLFQISLYVIVQPHSRYQIRRTTHYLWTNDRETYCISSAIFVEFIICRSISIFGVRPNVRARSSLLPPNRDLCPASGVM